MTIKKLYLAREDNMADLTLEQQQAIAIAQAKAKAAMANDPSQKQTLYTEDTVYDPVSGLPLSSPAYGPETTGGTRIAKNVLENVAAAPISVATGVARGSGATRIPQLVEGLLNYGKSDKTLSDLVTGNKPKPSGSVSALGQIERGMEDTGEGYGKYAQQALNITGQAAPMVMGGMAGSPLGATSVADRVMNVAGKIPVLPSYAQNIIGNAALGGISAAAAPESDLGDVGTGAALGGALPVAGKALAWTGNKALQGAKSIIEPLYEGGREKILGRALREAAGGEGEKAIANLRAYQPNVAGTQLTAGEVAGVPSLAATQRAVMATTPEATNLAAARQAANTQARTEALENIASPTRLSKYSIIRNDLGNELYTPALNTAMDFANLSKPMQSEVQSLIKSPAIKKAMDEAKENALNRGTNINDPAGSLRGLHETKMALDDQISSVKAKLQRDGKSTSSELDGLKSAKDRLLGFIETVSPEYKTARETYSRLSKPVDQLESIQQLAQKAVNPKDQQIYAGRFFNQLESLKKEGVLSPRQINRLETIADDLRKVDFGQTAGRGVGSDTVQKLAYTNMLNQAGIPNVLRDLPAGQVIGGLASRAGDVVYGNANRQLTSKLAEALMSPQETARLMELGGKTTSPILTQQQKQLAKILMMQRLQGE
jgi:hypothetical protein